VRQLNQPNKKLFHPPNHHQLTTKKLLSKLPATLHRPTHPKENTTTPITYQNYQIIKNNNKKQRQQKM